MIIGIDARFYGPKFTGIGRYVQNLILQLGKTDHHNHYVIFGPQEIKKDISTFTNFEYQFLDTRPYSFSEQIINPLIFYRAKLDLLHVPHFNAPLLYFRPYVITIHDLIKHLSTGKGTSTLPYFQYLIKLYIYKIVILYHLLKSKHIITPSEYWKSYLIKHFNISDSKVTVTYEGVSTTLSKSKVIKNDDLLSRFGIHKPFLIYTGNLYPHKNIPFAVDAIREFNRRHEHDLQLAIVCARQNFLGQVPTDPLVRFCGYLDDAELHTLYSQAYAFVQPSLIEGFGLVGLEAMSTGLPVLSSTSTCLPELYGSAALYFDPQKQSDLVDKIHHLISNPEVRQEFVTKGLAQVKKYSWSKMAKQTLSVYSTCKLP